MKLKNTVYAFLIALVISGIWTYFNRYEYVGNNMYILDRINVFPLVLWTLGLTILYIFHSRLKSKYPLFHTIIFYLVALSIIEAFGYHVLSIRLNSNYPSLLHLGIVHAPLHMKIFYIIAGPVYIMITDFLIKKET